MSVFCAPPYDQSILTSDTTNDNDIVKGMYVRGGV